MKGPNLLRVHKTRLAEFCVLVFAVLFFGIAKHYTSIAFFSHLVPWAGGLLLLLLPGLFINKFWLRSERPLTILTYALCSSIALHILLLLALALPLRSDPLSWYVVGAAVGAYIVGLFAPPLKIDWRRYEVLDVVIILIPVAFFFVSYTLNPRITEGDSYYFIYAAIDSFKAGKDVSPYVNRPGFIPLLGVLNLGIGFSYQVIFKLFLPGLFYATLTSAMDFVEAHSPADLFRRNRWFYVAILAIPVVTAEVDIARTQSLILAFTVPILLLLARAPFERKNQFLIVAAVYSLALTRIHELGYPLVLLTLIMAAYVSVKYYRLAESKLDWLKVYVRNALIGAVILFPYLRMALGNSAFIYANAVLSSFMRQLSVLHWQWWFLGSYSVDGWDIGWSGQQAALYYLYNGILFALGLALVLFFIKRQSRRSFVLPAALYAIFYLIVAELLPRIGFYYYPNRAWPHLMLGLWVVMLACMLNARFRTIPLRNIAYVGLFLVICSGLYGWLTISSTKGGFYNADEQNIVKFLAQDIPSNAVVYSTQTSNEAILEVYANKATGYLDYTTSFTSESQLKQMVLAAEAGPVVPQTDQGIRQTIVLDSAHQIVSEEQEPYVIQNGNGGSTPEAHNRPVYFYYSFSRFEGLMGQRTWWQAVNNYNMESFFQSLQSADVVYRDHAGVVLKLY